MFIPAYYYYYYYYYYFVITCLCLFYVCPLFLSVFVAALYVVLFLLHAIWLLPQQVTEQKFNKLS
jgi:hypothetical protein